MFTIINKFEDLPNESPNGTNVFVSEENSLYICFDNIWTKYEDDSNFKKISEVSMENDFDGSGKDVFVFENTVFYDKFEYDKCYLLTFSCENINKSIKEEAAVMSLVTDSNTVVFNMFDIVENDNIFIKVYHYTPMYREDGLDPSKIKKTLDQAFNAKVSNLILKGPIIMSLYSIYLET